METPRAFAALVCFGVACNSPDFSSVNDAPEPSAGKAGNAGGSAGKSSGSAAASGRSGVAGSGATSSGGSGGGAGSTGGAAPAGGQDGSGGAAASGGSGGSVGGADATGGDGGTSETGGAAGTGGDLGSGGDAASGGTTGGSGPAGASGGGNAGGPAGSGPGGSAGAGGTGGSSGSAGMPASGGTGGDSSSGGVGGSGGMLGGCDNQLLANADFEAGPTPSWQEESDKPGLEIIVPASDVELMAEGVAPYAGSYLAWLGGITDNMWDHYDVILRQNVFIPEDASALTLSGVYHIQSEDSGVVGYDVAYLEFETDAGTVWQAVHWTNVDQTSDWQTFTLTTDDAGQVDALRGQTVTFVAYSRTDPTGKTSFFLDNLKLEAECGR